MKLYFRGVPYEHNPPQPREVFQLVPQSALLLRYRGVLYIREGRSPYPGQTSTEITRSPNDSTGLDIS